MRSSWFCDRNGNVSILSNCVVLAPCGTYPHKGQQCYTSVVLLGVIKKKEGTQTFKLILFTPFKAPDAVIGTEEVGSRQIFIAYSEFANTELQTLYNGKSVASTVLLGNYFYWVKKAQNC